MPDVIIGISSLELLYSRVLVPDSVVGKILARRSKFQPVNTLLASRQTAPFFPSFIARTETRHKYRGREGENVGSTI
jgi:hypothetical protein